MIEVTNLEVLVSTSQALLRIRGEWSVVDGIDSILSRDIRNVVAAVWELMNIGDDTIISDAIDELERRAIANEP